MNRYADAPILGPVPLGMAFAIALGAFGITHLSRSGPNVLALSMASAFAWAAYELVMRVPLLVVARALPLLIVMAAIFTFAAACATLAYSWIAGAWW